MNPIAGINSQANPVTQPQRSESKGNTASSVSFGAVFEAIRRSLDGVMVVAEGTRAGEADFNKNKLEVERARQFKTELEEAQDILNKITKILDEAGEKQA